jgi:hypothetical protein
VIELDSPSVTAEQVAAIEQSVNQKIRDRLPVSVRELSLDDPEVEQVRREPAAVSTEWLSKGSSSNFRQPCSLPSVPGEGSGFAR